MGSNYVELNTRMGSLILVPRFRDDAARDLVLFDDMKLSYFLFCNLTLKEAFRLSPRVDTFQTHSRRPVLIFSFLLSISFDAVKEA